MGDFTYAEDDIGDLQVSSRGQMSLPAAARRRWGIEKGGRIGYVDLGDCVVLFAGGVAEARRQIFGALTEEDWARAREGFGDPDLRTE